MSNQEPIQQPDPSIKIELDGLSLNPTVDVPPNSHTSNVAVGPSKMTLRPRKNGKVLSKKRTIVKAKTRTASIEEKKVMPRAKSLALVAAIMASLPVPKCIQNQNPADHPMQKQLDHFFACQPPGSKIIFKPWRWPLLPSNPLTTADDDASSVEKQMN